MKQEMNMYAAGMAVNEAEDVFGYADSAMTLDHALSEVETNPDLCDDELAAAISATPDEALSNDILAMAAEDPVLASLIKQYLNASRQHKALMKRYGYHDPMADVAADMVDSAWCAIQTRIIELRMAQDESRGAVKPKAILTSRKAENATWPARQPKAQGDDFLYFLMWLALMLPELRANAHKMAANAFARAAG